MNAITDLRRVIYGLRPPALDELRLAGSLREQIGRPQCQAPTPAISLGTPSTGLASQSVAVQMATVLYVGGPSRTLVRG